VVEEASEVEAQYCGLGAAGEGREGLRTPKFALVEGVVVMAREVANPLPQVGVSGSAELGVAEASFSPLLMLEQEVGPLVY
jgi:hypothetical protein